MAQQQGRSPEVDAELKKLQGVQNGQCPCVVLLQSLLVVQVLDIPTLSCTSGSGLVEIHPVVWCDTSRVTRCPADELWPSSPTPRKDPGRWIPTDRKTG